jgi:hypothetical protein
MSFFAAIVTLIVIAIIIALFVYQRGKMNNFGVDENTDFGPAYVQKSVKFLNTYLTNFHSFWMNIAVFILTFIAAFIVCFHHRRQRTAQKADTYVPNTGYSQPTGWRRFIPRRNKY